MKLTLEHICKRYDKTIVLNNLSLTFPSGTLTALVGPSGCGKTTILNLISGVLQPDSGRILFDDRCVNDVPLAKRNIGYVFQAHSLYPNMTVYENIRFPLRCMRLPMHSRKEKKDYCNEQIHHFADMLQITPLLDRMPDELSGGQQQRVAIARALVRNPDLLLMDEPFANLDRKLSIQLREEVQYLQRRTGITTIFVTHNQQDAHAIADYITLMDHGVIQQCGDAQLLYQQPANLFVADFFGDHGSCVLSSAEAAELLPVLCGHLPNGTCHVSFRPAQAHLMPGGSFVIEHITQMFYCQFYRIRSGNCVLTVMDNQTLGEGTQVSLHVPLEKLVFYDINGQRIDASLPCS